jgi:hypothetical protein
LDKLGISVEGFAYDSQIEDTLDGLAEHIETYLDVDKIFSLATYLLKALSRRSQPSSFGSPSLIQYSE